MSNPSLIDWPTFWSTESRGDDWLLEPVLPRGRSVAIYAAAKRGKSLILLDLLARLATGRRVLDRPAGEPVKAAYLDLEMTEDDLRERLEDMGYGPGDDLSNLYYYLLPSLPPLDSIEGGDALLSIAEEHRPAVIAIDTLSRVLAGEENASDTLRNFYTHTSLPLKAMGITLVRLDHAGKDLERGQRGTSAKADDVDLVWQLSATEDGVRLKATHRRQAWVPEVVDLVRLSDPLRHERAAQAWPSGTAELARSLAAMGLSHHESTRAVQAALRAAGSPARRELIVAAQRWRRQSLEPAGTTFGNHREPPEPPSGTAGTTSGTTPEPPSGTGFGNHWEPDSEPPPEPLGTTLEGTWEPVPPLKGEPGSQPARYCPEPGCDLPANDCPFHGDPACSVTGCGGALAGFAPDGRPLCARHFQRLEVTS